MASPLVSIVGGGALNASTLLAVPSSIANGITRGAQLIKSSGLVATTNYVSAALGIKPDSLSEIDDAYIAKLTRASDPGIEVWAAVPEKFQVSLSSKWDALMNDTGSSGEGAGGLLGAIPGISSGLAGKIGGYAAMASKAGRLFGAQGFAQVLTQQVWGGTGPLKLSIPFQFIARDDVKKDVADPVRKLFQLASPTALSDGGASVNKFFQILHAPGPSLADTLTGGGKNVIAFDYGSTLKLPSVVIESLSLDYRNLMLRTTKTPFDVTVNVGLITSYTLTADQIADALFPLISRDLGLGTVAFPNGPTTGGAPPTP